MKYDEVDDMGKNSAVIYHSYLKRFKNLSDAQFGQLIKAALIYDQTGEVQEIDDEKVSDAFSFIQFDIDENRESWEDKKAKRVAAGAAGGKATQSKSSKTKQIKQMQANEANQAVSVSVSVSDKVSVNDISLPDPPLEKPEEPEGFDEFWDKYPRHVGKQDAIKAWRKIKSSEHGAVMAGVEAALKSDEWKKNIKNKTLEFIPHASTWLNGRRWEDERFTVSVVADDVDDIPPEYMFGGRK